ncbi:phospholipase [Streptoalloteichus hindustanus]|uniref:Phospholipase A2 n=1 Tax=Streptoalloteichus hindustanus TaxID=2017 RepID=A0A1M5AXN5_STRHI|nr:phospholipase A2 [Streptoalloteichus hindustanus]
MATTPAPAAPRRTARGALTAAVLAACASLFVGVGTAEAALTPAKLRSVTDEYLFSKSLSQFHSLRAKRPHSKQLDWSSDGCSKSPDAPLGYDFLPACQRHDFGYRNYKKQSRFTKDNRKRIDDNFRADMYSICDDSWTCKRTADIYYHAVRKFGGSGATTAEVLTIDSVRHEAQAVAAADAK